MNQDKRKQFAKVKEQLDKVRAIINLHSQEEAKLLKEMGELEKELFPAEYQKKVEAALVLLRHRRLGK